MRRKARPRALEKMDMVEVNDRGTINLKKFQATVAVSGSRIWNALEGGHTRAWQGWAGAVSALAGLSTRLILESWH